jgi:transcriptional regulator with XRE-family HTH domain
MRLRDPKLLRSLMSAQDRTQSDLARQANCSRQFIHMLLTGKRRSCTDDVATAIEGSLSLLPGTLFMADVSSTKGQNVAEEAVA